MKTISMRDLQKSVKTCVDEAQGDRVVITRHGRPAAVLVGVEGADWETVVLQSDPKFWRLIRARRKQPTISLEELERFLQTERAPNGGHGRQARVRSAAGAKGTTKSRTRHSAARRA